MKVSGKVKFAFSDPPPVIGEQVWANLTRRQRIQGKLVRRGKHYIVIRPEGGVDITIDNPKD